jgi:D-aminopeptidase
MKVFLSTDMEGTAGVVDWTQCRGPNQEYEYDRGQLQAEVNAAIDGARGVEQRDEKLVAIRTDDPLRLPHVDSRRDAEQKG